MRKRGITAFVVLLLVLTPIGSVTTLGAVTNSGTSTAEGLEIQSNEINTSSSISMWKQAPLPLRADLDTAETTVENQGLFLGVNRETVSANRESVGVFGVGDIELEFGKVSGDTTSTYNGDNVTLFVGKVDSDVTVDDFELIRSLRQNKMDTLNDNISFEKVETSTIENGEFSETYTADKSGQYVAILATIDERSDPAITLEGDDLVAPGQSTVIGVEEFLVQDSRSAVSVSGGGPGDDISFDINTSLDDSVKVDHAVVVYNEETFTDSMSTIHAPGNINMNNISGDDPQIEHDIAAVNGITTLQTDIAHFGLSAGSQRYTGTTSIADIVAFAGNKTDLGDPNSVASGDTVLDASVTAVGDAGAEDVDVTVETVENWREGEYRWIHVATEENTDQFATSTGTIEIEEDDSSPSPDPSPSPRPSPEPDPNPDPISAPEFVLSDPHLDRAKIAVGESVTASATVRNGGNASSEFTAALVINGETVDTRTVQAAGGAEETVAFTKRFDEPGEYQIEIGDLEIGTVTVDETASKPESATFDLRNVTLSETAIDAGDDVDITAVVENVGAEAGTYTIDVRVDGDVTTTSDVTLEGGEPRTVTVTETFDEAGDYEIAINDIEAGTVTVTEPNDGTPGFGAVAALASLVAALFVIRVSGAGRP